MLRTFCSLKSMYWEVWWSAGSNPNIWNVRMNSIWIGFEGGGQLSNIYCIFFWKYCRGVGGWGAGHCQWQTPNNKNAIFPTTCELYFAKYSEFWIEHHVEEEHASREKKLSMVNLLVFVHKNEYRIGFQEIKIHPWGGFELGPFFSLLLMRKRLSSGQKWFLRATFPTN